MFFCQPGKVTILGAFFRFSTYLCSVIIQQGEQQTLPSENRFK